MNVAASNKHETTMWHYVTPVWIQQSKRSVDNVDSVKLLTTFSRARCCVWWSGLLRCCVVLLCWFVACYCYCCALFVGFLLVIVIVIVVVVVIVTVVVCWSVGCLLNYKQKSNGIHHKLQDNRVSQPLELQSQKSQQIGQQISMVILLTTIRKQIQLIGQQMQQLWVKCFANSFSQTKFNKWQWTQQ